MIVTDGHLRQNPFAHLKLSCDSKDRTPAFLAEDIDRVLGQIAAADPVTAFEQRDHALMVAGSRVGPRRKEIRGLTWGIARRPRVATASASRIAKAAGRT